MLLLKCVSLSNKEYNSMDEYKLIETIKNGEGPYVEFKEQEVKAIDLAAEIVAFSNSDGGMILLGVSDDGSIKGVNTANVEEKIMNICRTNCIPNIVPVIEKHVIGDSTIVSIVVPKGTNKPYYTANNKYYIRVGTTKRIASKEELLRLFESSGSYHYDISPVRNSSIKDLNISSIRDYFLKYNMFDLNEEDSNIIERILTNADILTTIGKDIVPTVGGILIFGKSPADKLPQNGISFAHFAGDDISKDLIDKKQIIGTLPDIAENTLAIIKNNTRAPSGIKGMKREESQPYPDVVLREAIVNSLVHRNYGIAGSKIRVLMFDNRIEFHSPGRLPNTVTIEKMKIGVSYARNPFLVKYMENLRYIDQLGRGIPMIIKTMQNTGAPEPELKESGEEFLLTVFHTTNE
jgi:ATP-dependent DNA helicase RecG